ncbi:hypothetical protein [secondary endosymbiont of Ctenarytaina eucalypti]|uniref:Uncharacterized protein n=1 Tax=secondary endosymbiont of Ctenarytaina eucalypti TaxID=1199245 RepID=J3YRI0_9ENTR|nr:hypothetical protein [secondary endosymbiont of Ctenarytaina eucalypti]AFP84668.1 hypothetical protein A359_02670 [secondary endosymbiont of Ctenarytaina eucalypti]
MMRRLGEAMAMVKALIAGRRCSKLLIASPRRLITEAIRARISEAIAHLKDTTP